MLLREVPSGVLVLPMVFGVAAVDAVEKAAGRSCRLKWPNDIMLDGRKLGGILIEPRWKGPELDFCVCGVGMNVNNPPMELEAGRESSNLAGATTPDELLGALLDALATRLSENAAALKADYEVTCETFGKDVEVPRTYGGGRGRAVGVDIDGRLIVDTGGRRVVLSSLD